MAGLWGYGTLAAGRFLTDPQYMQDFCKRTGFKLDKNNMQIVIGTEVIQGNPGRPRFWPPLPGKVRRQSTYHTSRYLGSCLGYRNSRCAQTPHSRILPKRERDATPSTLWGFKRAVVMATCITTPTRRTR